MATKKIEWPDGLKNLVELTKQRREIFETAGRHGMLNSDFDNFKAYSVRKWTKRELTNRIAWLKEQRGSLLGKPDKAKELAENAKKLARYTKELFRRGSERNQKKEREEHNAKRRRVRAVAKRKRLKTKTDVAIEKRKALRKSLISLSSRKAKKTD